MTLYVMGFAAKNITAQTINFVNSSFTYGNRAYASNQLCLGNENENQQFSGYTLPEVVVYVVLTTSFCLFAFVGNLLVIFAVIKDNVISKHRHNLYLLSLAVADALLVVSVVPFSLANELLGYWPFGDAYCRIYLSVDILFCTASICNICCIGIDRFISINFPITYRRYRTINKIRIAISFVWMYAAAVSLLPFTGTEIIHGRTNECFINDSSWFIIFSSALSFFLPAFIIGPVYTKIFFIGRRLEASSRARSASSISEEDKATSAINLQKAKVDSRSPSLRRLERVVSPTLRPGLEEEELAPISVNKNYSHSETNVIRSIGLNTSAQHQPPLPIKAKHEKALLPTERQDVSSLDQPSISPLEKQSHANDQQNQYNNGKRCSDFSVIEEKRCNSVISDTVFVDDNSLSTTSEMNRRCNNNYLVFTRASLKSENISRNKQKKQNSKGLFNSCCIKSRRKEDESHSEQDFDVQPRLSGRVEYVKNNTKNLKQKTKSSSSFSSSKINHQLARRSSAASTQRNHPGQSRRERRFIFVISVITGCFLICWSPFFVTYFIYAVCRESCCINPVMFKVFFWVGYLNSAINPVLYTIFNKDFRRAFKKLFRFPKAVVK